MAKKDFKLIGEIFNMIAMTIAGFDPSGGAGILSDIKTFHAMGVYGTAVITSLTAQNPSRVEAVEPVSTDFIDKQIDTVLEYYHIEYAKSGMLYNTENVKLLSEKVLEHQLNLVVDPVMVAGCGDLLSIEGYAQTLKKYLLPHAVLTTPNINEAEQLSGIKILDLEDAIKAATKIGNKCDVVITGGHLNGSNVFFNGNIKVIEGELIESVNTHGTGCSYSAAITAGLEKGLDFLSSIEIAGEFVKNSVVNGDWGTLNQFHDFKSV
jgi:hydroxymethylpyrimidine/phosphomethylpyrimidine kinase